VSAFGRLRRIPRWILLPVLALVLLPPGCGGNGEETLARVRREGVLRVGTDATYPPFETVDPAKGGLVGFDVDLMRAIGEKLGARVDFTIVPFDGILGGLSAGRYDAVISALTITEERAREVLFSEPYYAAGQSICVRSDAAIGDLQELKGKRIGVQLGTTGERTAQDVPHAQVVSFDAIGAAFLDLRNGRLEAVIADTPTATLFARAHPEVRLVGKPITRESYGIALRRADEKLKRAIDEAIRDLEASGRTAALRGLWGLEEP
jgi:polar amino acid transport system substrate-binding protein